MNIYLGNSGKLCAYLGNKKYTINLHSKDLLMEGIYLMSSEPYFLRDINGNYLTVLKEKEEE